jgi:hypothetical protein
VPVAAEVAEVAAEVGDVALAAVDVALVPVDAALVEPGELEAAASPSWPGVASGGSEAASERVLRWRAAAGAATLVTAPERLDVL